MIAFDQQYHNNFFTQHKMESFHKITLVLSLITLLNCEIGVDVSTLQTSSVYECMKNEGFTFAVPRAYHSYGAIDQNAVPGIHNARAAGLKTDIYMFPCRGKNASAQVDELIKGIPGDLYDIIWVDVQTNPSTNCSWSNHDFNTNCDFLLETIQRIKSHGRKVGVYTTPYFWDKIFGARLACPKASSALLWYARYDNSAAFNDYGQIGGWSAPHMKQYAGDVNICGANSDKNYRP